MNSEDSHLSAAQREVLRQKDEVLTSGGYAVIPHVIYRDVLPKLLEKYNVQTARDCVFLYGYFQAYVNGTSGNTEYMWAFPSVDKIVQDTGIKRNRVKPLCDALEAEGLLVTQRIPWYGHTKKMFMPMYLHGEYCPSTFKDT